MGGKSTQQERERIHLGIFVVYVSFQPFIDNFFLLSSFSLTNRIPCRHVIQLMYIQHAVGSNRRANEEKSEFEAQFFAVHIYLPRHRIGLGHIGGIRMEFCGVIRQNREGVKSIKNMSIARRTHQMEYGDGAIDNAIKFNWKSNRKVSSVVSTKHKKEFPHASISLLSPNLLIKNIFYVHETARRRRLIEKGKLTIQIDTHLSLESTLNLADDNVECCRDYARTLTK